MGSLMILFTLVACDTRTSAGGRVSGPDGRPISGASINLEDKKSGKTVTGLSKSDGSFAVTRIHGAFYGPMHLVVSKPGFTTVDRAVAAKQQNIIDISLTPAAPSQISKLSQALVGKQITVRGSLVVGKPGACVVLENQQEVCLIEMHPKGASDNPFSGMYDKLVEATGTLKFYRGTAPAGQGRKLAIQQAPDQYYFEQETTELRLITH